MVERSKRGGSGKKQLLGNHQRCWLWGRNLVYETLDAGRWPILELCLSRDLAAETLNEVRQLASRRCIPARVEDRETLTRLCHSAEHQGYVARMAPFPYATAEDVLNARPAAPLYLVLDSLQDPYNFGAIL